MTKAIRFDKTGGPEVMKWVDVERGRAGQGRDSREASCGGAELSSTCISAPASIRCRCPAASAWKAAGEVTAVGEGVTQFKPGDRVAYASRPPGAYAQERVMPAEYVVKLPDAIGYEEAASVMLQGLTAQYLLRRTYRVKAGDTMLIHAAAGGVGMLACQWAKALGATVIGTVGSDEKAEIAKAHGCDHPIVYTRENFTKRVREITNGAGVPVVYDSIGKDTYIGVARLPRAARHVRELRQFVGAAAADRFVGIRRTRFAVLHAADALQLYRQAQRSRCDGGGTVRRAGRRAR